MAGLYSTTVALTVCESDVTKTLDVEKLRKGAFSDAIDAEGIRSGWVGLGNLLDTDNFFMASCDSRFSGFSWRMDMRKPSAALIRLQLEERIRDERQKGNRVGAKRKKELREEITDKLTVACDFIPSMTDCLWDAQTGRLMIASTSEKLVEKITLFFKGCFGIEANPICPEKDMSALFSQIQRNNGLEVSDFYLQPMGSANLKSSPANEEISVIDVQNNPTAVSEALNKGLFINKIALVATEKENEANQLYFSINENLLLSGLRLPKAEKGDDEDARFLINADICARAAGIAVEMGKES